LTLSRKAGQRDQRRNVEFVAGKEIEELAITDAR